ncbi:MAG: hypothetical protein HYY06_26115 [Deltaproteobacteria bacterium]|nr:hypothetical protein [Deltaproteobacteria bacterium]
MSAASIPSLVLGTRRARIWLLVVALLGVALQLVPLFDLLGYELSFAAALVASLGAGLVGAGLPAEILRRGTHPDRARRAAVTLVGAALFAAGLMLLPPLVLSSANALRVPNCDWVEGLTFYLLIAVPGALLASVVGAAMGVLFASRRRASLAFLAIYLGSIAWSLVRFHSTPAIFAFDPFAGWFAGTIYDEVVEVGAALVTYRVGTVAAVLAVSLGLAGAVDGGLRPSWKAAGRQGFLVVLAVFSGLGALAVFAFGEDLGHRHDSSSIARALGGRIETRRFVVHYPDALPIEDARRLGRDCELRLAQVEALFGARVRGRIRAFFFRDARQKRELVGAADTFIAKPWRREVYLQLGNDPRLPHPVLKHEIAHVVAGSFAPPPFRVSARLFGLWPNPGLIEGAAVAAGWERDELDPHQWSRAMMDLGIGPSPSTIQGLWFLERPAAQSYTLAGSFCRFLIDRHGASVFKRAYRDGDLEAAYGRPLSALVREWKRFLRTVPLAAADRAAARARFDRPGIFGLPCAHENAQLRARVRELGAGGNHRQALRLCREIARNDPGSVRDRIALLGAMIRAGRLDEAERAARAALRDRRVGEAARREASERLADIAWMRGRADLARLAYAELLERAPTEDDVRMLTVKATATADPSIAPTLRAFLLGDHGEPVDSPIAVFLLQGLLERSEREGGPSGMSRAVVAYLLGRQLWNQRAPELARPYFEEARRVELPGLLSAENRRLMGASAYLLGDARAARATFEDLARDARVARGTRAEALDWLDRLDFDEGRSPRARSVSEP